MVLNYRKHQPNIAKDILKDARGDMVQLADKLRKKDFSALIFFMIGLGFVISDLMLQITEVLSMCGLFYFWWLHRRPQTLPFKMPKSAGKIDPNDKTPGSGKARPAEGILYLGVDDASGEEIWFNNDDARTHILYLGTTGSGKSEGLKGFVSNALGWGSGFIYIDGKADTALWGALSALTRRYGRDDDLLVLNYMTGNSDKGSVSNSINPFALGSASYLTNLLVSLMPDTGGDNAMWKDRAVALMSVVMPVLTWKRDEQEIPLSINLIREELQLRNIVSASRDKNIPDALRRNLNSYLAELSGYRDEFFNDDGSPRAGPNGQANDTSTTEQQHGYLTMQFTKQMQSLSGDYGYIFLNPHADIDIMDVVLNRRILVVLIPALEKSADEAANLGKIVASMLKGMMGATLGSQVEGDTDMALENRPTNAPTPFMAVFDEVGYYATSGMAVMAAQARSLGFSLVFAGQDLPALEKRIKEEARSITANCNIKIFGKLEDPTQTKEFFEKTVGKALVLESGGRKQKKTLTGSKIYEDSDQYSLQARDKADYDDLKGYLAGQAVVCFGDHLVKAKMFKSDPGKISSLRVNRFVSLVHPDPLGKRGSRDVEAVLERFRDKNWTAEHAHAAHDAPPGSGHSVITELAEGFAMAREQRRGLVESGAYALTWLAYKEGHLKKEDIPDPQIDKAPALADKEPATLQAPDESAIKLNTVPAAAEPVAQPVTKPAVMTAPKELTPPPEPIDTDLRAAKDDTDSAHDATAESVNWDDFLKGETPATVAAKKQTTAKSGTDRIATDRIEPTLDTDSEDMSPEAQAAIAKGTQETMSWAALMGEEPATKSTEPPKPAPAAIPQTSFGVGGYSGFGGYGLGGGISYAQPGSTPVVIPPEPAAPPEKIGAQLKDNTPQTKQSDPPDDDDATSETINWKDLV